MDNKTAARVAKHFDLFYYSEVFEDIIDNFSTVCEILQIQPTNYVNFYSTLKVISKIKIIKSLRDS